MEPLNRSCGPEHLNAETSVAAMDEHRAEPPVPDGEYDAAIEGLRFTESPTSFIPMMVWTFRIRLGRHCDHVLRKHRPLTSASLRSLKGELTKCGVSLRRFSELPERAQDLIGRDVRIAKRTRAGNVEIRILWAGREDRAG